MTTTKCLANPRSQKFDPKNFSCFDSDHELIRYGNPLSIPSNYCLKFDTKPEKFMISRLILSIRRKKTSQTKRKKEFRFFSIPYLCFFIFFLFLKYSLSHHFNHFSLFSYNLLLIITKIRTEKKNLILLLRF